MILMAEAASGKVVVNYLSMRIEKGEIFGFLGLNINRVMERLDLKPFARQLAGILPFRRFKTS